MNETALHQEVTVIIPCGGSKLAGTHPARELYTGQAFRHQLAAAEAIVASEGGRVLILSALHGLVDLDEELSSYDVKMGDPASVSPITVAIQMAERGLVGSDTELSPAIYTLLPRAYFSVVHTAAALLDVYPQDVYEAAPGQGFQRGVSTIVRATH